MGLSPTEIFKPFGLENAKGIVAAVSGGSDSLALLFLLKEYLTTLDSPPSLTAVTIDHRLRDESANEAEYVGVFAMRMALLIVSWLGMIRSPKAVSLLLPALRATDFWCRPRKRQAQILLPPDIHATIRSKHF